MPMKTSAGKPPRATAKRLLLVGLALIVGPLAAAAGATAPAGAADETPAGYMVADSLWIGAVIHTEDKGAIEGRWQPGGDDTTARGDRVIWGHFYADPEVMSWGSANNPDLFVKIWMDVSGPVYVDFFHVSVPDIDVYSGRSGADGYENKGTTTLLSRFAEHAYFASSSGEDENDAAPDYAVVDTGQAACYDGQGEMTPWPVAGESFYGQDAQHSGNSPDYTDNGDGTVTDNVTGLMWQQSPDTDGDGDIDADDKMTYDQAVAGAGALALGGHSDWRLPTIKELYSLIVFSGRDPSGYDGNDTSGLVPFIDTGHFDFAYGDTRAGERIIDAQYASATKYVSTTANGDETLFGVNFADGRIKGYGLSLFGSEKTFYVIYVRGNQAYGQNDFVNNGDGTISDRATGLMWSQDDSATGLDWQDALSWVEEKNAEKFSGYSDWRLPNAKELQSIVDYGRSPDTTGSAAIDPLFNATGILNEAGKADYACYWSSTTHANWTPQFGAYGVYVAFGRAMGYMNGTWVDVHGAGAQRSDPKSGDPVDWPTGHGPQGDAIRIYNYVRLVRDAGH